MLDGVLACTHVNNLAKFASVKRKEATQLKSFTVRIPEKLIERLKFRALKQRTTVQELAARAFEAYLKQRGGQ
jgi:predicted HicB family RNase H-like nuclease